MPTFDDVKIQIESLDNEERKRLQEWLSESGFLVTASKYTLLPKSTTALKFSLYAMIRILFGRNVSSAFHELKEDVVANANSIRGLHLITAAQHIAQTSPFKVYALAEALFLYWFRDRFLLRLLIGVLVGIAAVGAGSFSIYFLHQQNRLIGEQTLLLAAQQRSVDAQTTLLRSQTNASEQQLKLSQALEKDQEIDSSLDAFANFTTVDYPYISQLADDIVSLNIGRRGKHLRTISTMLNAGQAVSAELEAYLDAFGKLDLLKIEADSLSDRTTEHSSQYAYLASILLANQVAAHLPGSLPVGTDRAIYGLDLTNCNFAGADFSDVTLIGCKVNIPVAGATKQPNARSSVNIGD